MSTPHDAAARIRAYLDADTSSNSFGRLMPYELGPGAPRALSRTDLIAVLDALEAVEKAVKNAYPWRCDSPTHNTICHLRALTPVTRALGYGDPDPEGPEYVAYEAPCEGCAAKGGAS